MDPQTIELFAQIVLAVVLGAAMGMEREVHGKPAGLRTYSLVALGACLFTLVSLYGFKDGGTYDPSRVASQVVVGIGFLGAGLIFFRGEEVQGLTTAAGLWVSAAVGMAVAVRMYWIAVLASLSAVFILRVLRWLEPYINTSRRRSHGNDRV